MYPNIKIQVPFNTRLGIGGTSGPVLPYTPFVLDGVLTSSATLTRASSATYFDSAGVLQVAAINAKRVNYDHLTLVKKGLLIEAAVTNSCLRSDDFSNATWVKTNCTAAKNATGLNGVASSASTLTATGANATCLQAFVHASSTRCGSMYVKRKTGTGTVEMTVDNGTTWTALSLNSTFKRFFVAQAAVTNGTFGLRIVTSGDEVEVDGCQYEMPTGTSEWQPTSYIPTVGSTMSRSADVLIDAPFAFGTEGTIFFEGSCDFGAGASGNLFYASDNTTNNRITIMRTTTKVIEADTYSGGVRAAVPTTAATTVATKFKLAYGWKLNDFGISLNGGAAVTDVSGAAPIAMTEYATGNSLTGGTELKGHILNLFHYNTKKTSAELATMSTL